MTIACLYLSPEGIVLGADSTSSVPVEKGLHYFDFNQKVFEIGENSTLGMLTWGLGNLWPISFRTLLAELADEISANPVSSVEEVASRWVDHFWKSYEEFSHFKTCVSLSKKSPHNPSNIVDSNTRTAEEEDLFSNLMSGLQVGFCIAGYVPPNRRPSAAEILFSPLEGKPSVSSYEPETRRWWGVPNIIDRLVYGADQNLIDAVLSSNQWTGTREELTNIVISQQLNHGSLPMRDAIDYVYSCIHSTIKAMKFSNLSQVCGGPIEIAVITTDRNFRWVRHKSWDAAIVDGEATCLN